MLRPVMMLALAFACVFASLFTGCVRRTIAITSEPSGALVHLNGREVGRTPITVDFQFYGMYDVVLEKDGYEPLLTSGDARAPIWDNVPLDLGAELIPADFRSEIAWHYLLEPRQDDPNALLTRAAELRSRLEAAPQAATVPAASQPAAAPAH